MRELATAASYIFFCALVEEKSYITPKHIETVTSKAWTVSYGCASDVADLFRDVLFFVENFLYFAKTSQVSLLEIITNWYIIMQT